MATVREVAHRLWQIRTLDGVQTTPEQDWFDAESIVREEKKEVLTKVLERTKDMPKASDYYFAIDTESEMAQETGAMVVMTSVLFWNQNKHWDDQMFALNIPEWPPYLFEAMEAVFEWDNEMTPEQVKQDLIQRGFIYNAGLIK